MTFYACGNVFSKRRAFRATAADGTAYADNDEILFSFALNGGMYCVVGETPFATMTVREFIAYQRSLVDRLGLANRALKSFMKRAGCKCSPSARLKDLNQIEYRCVQIASKIKFDTKKLYVNFDGLKFSRKNKKVLDKVLKKWSAVYEVHVAVSDARYLPIGAMVENYDEKGNMTTSVYRGTSRSAILRAQMLDKKLCPPVKNIVICENSVR